MSQQQLAEKCGLATNYLSEIEREQKFPSVETIERIASELKIPAYALFWDTKTDIDSELLLKRRNEEFCETFLKETTKLFKDYGLME